MSFLIMLGTSVAYFYSVFAVVYNISLSPSPLLLPFFDSSAMLITFVLLGGREREREKERERERDM